MNCAKITKNELLKIRLRLLHVGASESLQSFLTILKQKKMNYSTDIKKAIVYVRANVDMDDVRRAITIIDHRRCPLYQADPALDCQIYDLMEEYGQDNDLPECWWMSEIDEDAILFEL